MARLISLDDVKSLRVVHDKPIRFLLAVEAVSNLSIIFFAFLYPSLFISYFFTPDDEITPLTSHLLFFWNSWIVVITALMFAAVSSKHSTSTLTAGVVHVRRFVYWALLSSEALLIILLIFTRHRTALSIGFSIFTIFVIIGRLIVLFWKKEWFGTVMIELPIQKDK